MGNFLYFKKKIDTILLLQETSEARKTLFKELLFELINKPYGYMYIYMTIKFLNIKNKRILKQLENRLLESKSSYDIYRFALLSPYKDLNKIKELLMKNKAIDYLVNLSCYYKLLDTDEIEEYLLDKKSARGLYYMLKYNKLKNANLYASIILNSKRVSFIYELLKYIESPELVKQGEDILLNSDSTFYKYLYFRLNKSENIDAFEIAIAKSNIKRYITMGAELPHSFRLKKVAILM